MIFSTGTLWSKIAHCAMRQSMNNPGAFEKENQKSIFISLPFNLSDKNNLNKNYETNPSAVKIHW